MPVMIHNKEYKTVAERLEEAHKSSDLESVETTILYLEPQIIVKATIKTKKGVFTGISGADPKKPIEAKTPVEVAETSAVGRALAFAGYAGSEIASADEIDKAVKTTDWGKNKATTAQRKFITDLMRDKGVDIATVQKEIGLKDGEKMTYAQASQTIEWLKEL